MHVEKYTGSQLGQMCAHYARDRESGRYGNENIDSDKTKFNYNLAPAHGMSDVDFINTRIAEVKHMNRADVIKMADWVITLPQDYKGNQEDFFKAAYQEFCSLHGEKNVVSSWVHLDETTPHMHFAFVPVAIDKKTGQEKLCAKEVINRQMLKEVHSVMERRISDRVHEPVHLLNDATRAGNKAIIELKRETAKENLEKIERLGGFEKIAENLEKAEKIENIKDKMKTPAEPERSVFGKETIPYSVYKRDISLLNAEIYRLEDKVHQERERADNANLRYLRANDIIKQYDDFFNDRERLSDRINDLDRQQQEHEHEHTFSRER